LSFSLVSPDASQGSYDYEDGYKYWCFGLINKRVSWYETTHCFDSADTHSDGKEMFTQVVDGLPDGVWRLRTYTVIDVSLSHHYRGGHEISNIIPMSTKSLYFMVNEERWRDSNKIDLRSLDEGRVVGVEGKGGSSAGRLAALDLSEHLTNDERLLSMLSSRAGDNNRVTVMMSNLDHLSMTNNAVYSGSRVGVNNVVLFGLSDGVCDPVTKTMIIADYDDEKRTSQSKTITTTTPCYQLPREYLSSLCGDCTNRDVWTKGFANIAIIKPSVMTAVISLNFDAVWMDTDIVLLSDPSPFFPPEKTISIQAGGQHTSYSITADESFRDEHCTGFYLIKASPESVYFLRSTVVELSLHEEDTKFGDQSAFNLVLFEWKFRYKGNGDDDDLTDVNVLSPLLFPGGSVYFDYHDLAYGPRANGKRPVMIHNNFLIGREKKIRRFQDNGLWFRDSDPKFFDVLRVPLSFAPYRIFDSAVPIHSATHHDPKDTSPFLLYKPVDKGVTVEKAIVTFSVGPERDFFESYTFPRMRFYANSIGVDLLVIRRMIECEPFIHSSSSKISVFELGEQKVDTEYNLEFHDCVKKSKIGLIGAAASSYSQILYVDDTVMVRKDSPDIFDLVPARNFGATFEKNPTRSADHNAAFMRMTCLRYSCHSNGTEYESNDNFLSNAYQDRFDPKTYFNSGVMVISNHHAPLILSFLASHYVNEAVIKRDQGFFNILAYVHGFELTDLGFRFNYLGGFINEDGDRVKQIRDLQLSPTEAYFVHLTTGVIVNVDPTSYQKLYDGHQNKLRMKIFSEINAKWERKSI